MSVFGQEAAKPRTYKKSADKHEVVNPASGKGQQNKARVYKPVSTPAGTRATVVTPTDGSVAKGKAPARKPVSATTTSGSRETVNPRKED